MTDYIVYHEPSMYLNGSKPNVPNWIITDVRFPNEAQAIKDRGGILIRVNRPVSAIGANKLKHKSITQHPSETALDDYQDWNYIIDNNGTIEDLIEKVEVILKNTKVL